MLGMKDFMGKNNNIAADGRVCIPRQKAGNSKDVHCYFVRFNKARIIRSKLIPRMTQVEVAKRLGVSKQLINIIELIALKKIIAAFEAETIERHLI